MALTGGFIEYTTSDGVSKAAVYATLALATADAESIVAAIKAQEPVVIDNNVIDTNRGPFIAQTGLVASSSAEAATTSTIITSGGSSGPATSSNSAPFSVLVGASSTQVLPANALRVGATLTNIGSEPAFVALGYLATATAFNAPINVGGYYEVPFGFVGAINAIGGGAQLVGSELLP